MNVKEAFGQVATLYDSKRRRAIEPAYYGWLPPGVLETSTEQLVASFSRHRDLHHDFYDEFGYDWCIEPESYQTIFEMNLQYCLLRTIVEIPREHPHYHRLGGISVRIYSSGSLTPECISHDAFRFIVIPTAYIMYLKEFLLALKGVGDIGRRARDTGDDRYGFFDGTTIKIGFQTGGAEALEYAERLSKFAALTTLYLDQTIALSDPKRLRDVIISNTPDGASSPINIEDAQVMSVFLLVDVFVMFHELTHLLTHDVGQGQRYDLEELEADRGAASLSTIFHGISRFVGFHPYGYMLGPLVFFSSMHLALQSRLRIGSILGMDEASVTQLRHEVDLLFARMTNYEKVLLEFGLTPPNGNKLAFRETLSDVAFIGTVCSVVLDQWCSSFDRG